MNVIVGRVDQVDKKMAALRVLVDREWPRGFTKRRLAVYVWLKDVAPSPGLGTWFRQCPDRWDDFRDRYHRELETKPTALDELFRLVAKGPVTLVSASSGESKNSAAALREFLSEKFAAYANCKGAKLGAAARYAS